MRARGLKRQLMAQRQWVCRVAPHAGAWIETIKVFANAEKPRSRPMRARGLKLYGAVWGAGIMTSRPMRARGLKLSHLIPPMILICVAPHAGAWIETLITVQSHPNTTVAPHAGAWIETENRICCFCQGCVAPHAGAWIETTNSGGYVSRSESRPMRARGLKQMSNKIHLG